MTFRLGGGRSIQLSYRGIRVSESATLRVIHCGTDFTQIAAAYYIEDLLGLNQIRRCLTSDNCRDVASSRQPVRAGQVRRAGSLIMAPAPQLG